MKVVNTKFVNMHPKADWFTKQQKFAFNAPDYVEVGDLLLVPTKQGNKVARVVGMGTQYPGKLRDVVAVFKEVEVARTRVRIKAKDAPVS